MTLDLVLNILSFLGSFGMFIYGIKHMSESIQRIAGHKMRKLFHYLTLNRYSGFLFGLIITLIIQSSSVTTVVFVGFVNTGLISVLQAIPVIIGANVGTTITGFLVSFLGFEVNFSTFILPLLGLSIPLVFSGIRTWKNFSEGIIGLYLIFFGFTLMREFLPNIEKYPALVSYIASFSGHGYSSILLNFVIGLFLTVIVQSSSAAMSLTLIMLSKDWISFESAAGMIIGENIATTLTAILASIIGNVQAKRIALCHFLFNIIGAAWAIPFIYVLIRFSFLTANDFFGISERSSIYFPISASLFHLYFNIITTILVIPFLSQMNRFVTFLLPESKKSNTKLFIGNYLIDTPELHLLEAKKSIGIIADKIKEMFALNKSLLFEKLTNSEQERKIKLLDDVSFDCQNLEDEVIHFVKELTQLDISISSSAEIVSFLSALNELGKIRQLNTNLKDLYIKKSSTYTEFKPALEQGLYDLFILVQQALNNLEASLNEMKNYDFAQAVELENQINELRDSLRLKHLKRVRDNKLGIGSSMIYRDLYTSLEKMADSCYNVHKIMQTNYEI